MTTPHHPVFDNAPLRGEVALSTGAMPVPYHVYDGHGLILFGTCPAASLKAPFDAEDVYPVLTSDGRGILVVFICTFAKASHGPHLEFHITALASPERGAVLPDDPADVIAAFATRPDWGVLSLKLWNDAPQVVAYNTEYLGLQALQTTGQMDVSKDRVSFRFATTDGQLIAAGDVRRPARADAGLLLRVMRRLGWGGLWRALRRQPARAHVINRKCTVLPRNGRAQTWTAPDEMVLTAFDAAQDRLEVDGGPLADYGFEPQVVQHLSPFRFVYLHPDDGASAST